MVVGKSDSGRHFLTNPGAGAPMIITLHATNPTPALVTAGSLVAIGFALSLIWGLRQ